jgi:hypothetical protein
VVENGRVLTVNEADILAELREYLPEYEQHRQQVWEQGERLKPAIEKTLAKAFSQSLSINRFSRSLSQC